MNDFLDKILHPFASVIAWIWVQIHNLLVVIGFSKGTGIAWALSIVILTLLVRSAIIPLFLKQIHSARGMQRMQPELQRIRAKYKGKNDTASKRKMAEETQAIYRKHGINPMTSCLPLLVQAPVFLGLYRTIYTVSRINNNSYQNYNNKLGPIDTALAHEISESTAFGIPLSHSVRDGSGFSHIAVFLCLTILMVVIQFFNMRISMSKNMPPHADPNNPLVKSQKPMMYFAPLMYVFSGLGFQIGIVLYTFTTNLFSFVQQIWTVQYLPNPGSPAFNTLVKKREAHYKKWAKPLFEKYAEERAAAAGDQGAIDDIDNRYLSEVLKKSKPQRINTNFPETLSVGEKVAIFRNLSSQEWTTLPDAHWMRGIHRATERLLAKKTNKERRREADRRLKSLNKQKSKEQNNEDNQPAESSVESQSSSTLEQRRRARQAEKRARAKKARKNKR